MHHKILMHRGCFMNVKKREGEGRHGGVKRGREVVGKKEEKELKHIQDSG